MKAFRVALMDDEDNVVIESFGVAVAEADDDIDELIDSPDFGTVLTPDELQRMARGQMSPDDYVSMELAKEICMCMDINWN